MDSKATIIKDKEAWTNCSKILIIRADNIGDVIMSGPAIRALKEATGAKITMLTSKMATGIASLMNEIDEVITYDLPWVKTSGAIEASTFFDIVQLLKEKQFDAAVIFTVFSQNPLPAAMLAYLAGIPKRLAYCRENPYELLTSWVPDTEPYESILHQVERDLALVDTVGAVTGNKKLFLPVSNDAQNAVKQKLTDAGIDHEKPWLICHAGVSEQKRQFSIEGWIETGKRLAGMGYNLLFTGTQNEGSLTQMIRERIGAAAFSVAGLFTLEEFAALIKQAPLVLTVNTGTAHIAAAVDTPVVVLYAATNPQHTPWMIPSKVLVFDVPVHLRTKNEVIQHLYRSVYKDRIETPSPEEIVDACVQLLKTAKKVETATETLTAVTH